MNEGWDMRFLSLPCALIAFLALVSMGAWSCAAGSTEDYFGDGGGTSSEDGGGDTGPGGHAEGGHQQADGGGKDVQAEVAPRKFTIGGMVTGLDAGDSVVLQDNLADNLTVTADGNFTFATPVASGAAYAVTVLTQPASPAEVCTVTSGSGKVTTADVTDIAVACTIPTFTIGGTITGLASGDSVVLQDNITDNLTVSANGSFTFATALANGAAYDVTILTEPDSPAETCGVTGGSGTVAGASVTSVVVTCSTTSPTVVSFPTATSTCAGPNAPGALGSGGGGLRWETGDSVSQSYARATSSTQLILDFTMSDDTEGCADGVTLDWNVELNGTVVGTYSWVAGETTSHTISETYTYASIAPIAGDFTIEVNATTTVCTGGGSWNWNPGGTATIE
jgi:hypothetical protein